VLDVEIPRLLDGQGIIEMRESKKRMKDRHLWQESYLVEGGGELVTDRSLQGGGGYRKRLGFCRAGSVF